MLSHQVPAMIDSSDVYAGVALLVTQISPYMDFLGTIGQVSAWMLGMTFLYWNIRKKRAEAKKAERDNFEKPS